MGSTVLEELNAIDKERSRMIRRDKALERRRERVIVSQRSPIEAHILIVDDNSMGLMARRTVLEELGHHVHTCSSGQEALEQYKKQRFDVVVTDYKMPKMNGVEFIRELRKHHPAAPGILTSGFADAP